MRNESDFQAAWNVGRSSRVWGLALIISLSAPNAGAATLKPETVEAWEDYLRTADARIRGRISPGAPFLWVDEIPSRASRVRNGRIVVSPAGPHIPMKISSGLIHDWIGAAFIPNATIRDVLPVLRDYGRYKEFYRPNVVDSRSVAKGESEDRFSMVLMNKVLFSRTALDSDYHASYSRLDDKRMYSVSQTTRIQEIAGYGTAARRTLPENEGTGLIWRLYSVIRFEERDGGLYVEVEAIALSRDIPAAVRFVAEPIVRRVSRDSLTTALRQTEDAVQAMAPAVPVTSGAVAAHTVPATASSLH